MNNEYRIDGFSSQASNQKALLKTFGWMAIGLLVTAATSFICLETGIWYVFFRGIMPLILVIGQVGLAVWMASTMRNGTVAKLKTLFMVYAITLGISLTPITLMYTGSLIFVAFLVTAVYFGCLVVIGMTTKKDLSKLGTICFAGLLTLIVTQLVMMLFHVGMETRIISLIGLLLFTGITAWDMQRVRVIINQTDGMTREKFSIYMAFEIYLDFINIFLYILELLGSRDR